ncbi:25799_t:CDS:2, partial [Dentiscutata erythropus]
IQNTRTVIPDAIKIVGINHRGDIFLLPLLSFSNSYSSGLLSFSAIRSFSIVPIGWLFRIGLPLSGSQNFSILYLGKKVKHKSCSLFDRDSPFSFLTISPAWPKLQPIVKL